MSTFFPHEPYHQQATYHYRRFACETYASSSFSVSTHYLGIDRDFLDELNRAETGAAAWLRRMELLGMPPYTPQAFAGRAQRAHRRHELAPLARGRVRSWRSLKEKRQAWGISA